MLLHIMLPQNLKKCQKCCNQWEKRKTGQTNYRYLASTNYPYFDHLSVFCCKIEIAQKINSFLLLSVTLTSYMVVEFKKGNKFYCVQAAKIIKSKVVVEDQILLTLASNFSTFFKYYFSNDKLPKRKSEYQQAYNWFIFVMFCAIWYDICTMHHI